LPLQRVDLRRARYLLPQDIQERVIRFGHLNNTDHPASMGVKKFAEPVAAKSGGKMQVKNFRRISSAASNNKRPLCKAECRRCRRPPPPSWAS
jgi:hypothetical protein